MLRIRETADSAQSRWHDLQPCAVGAGLQEDRDYLLELVNRPGARIYIDDVELAKDASGRFKWRPCFYAGRVIADVIAPGEPAAREQYFLDVGPSPAKSGQAAFDEMVATIRAFDPSLLSGISAASLEFGHAGKPGRYSLDILLSRMRAHGPDFLRTVKAFASTAHRSMAADSQLLPLSRLRRLHPTSLQDRRLAAIATGHALAAETLDSLQIHCKTSAPTFDTPANRALMALLRRFRAAARFLQEGIARREFGSPPEEQRLRADRRLEELQDLESRAHGLLLGAPFSHVTRAETTAAGLTQISAQPAYSRAWRIGSKALATGLDGEHSADYLHVSPSWGIYETWCFTQVIQVVGNATGTPGTEARSTAVAAQRCISFSLGNGATLEVLFQATFPALKPSGKRLGWSLSRERRPDIVLTHADAHGTSTCVLDAKWRSGRESVLDAMQSAHIYHDALRVDGNAPTLVLLLLPGASAVPELETAEFIQAHGVGAVSGIRAGGDGLGLLLNHMRQWLNSTRQQPGRRPPAP